MPYSSSASSPEVTAEQWMNAVRQVFDKVNRDKLDNKKNRAYVKDEGKTDGNGVTEFFACFDKAPPKCELAALGRRDDFRKIQFFNDFLMTVEARISGNVGESTIEAYVSLKDCSQPKIFLKPVFRGTDWVFLEKFGVMLDGVLVIDRKFDLSEANRETFFNYVAKNNNVSEAVHLALNKQEVDGLRRVVQAKLVLIRFTGQKGYAGINQESTKHFVQSIARLLRMHDALEQAVKGLGKVKDTACPK